jgi:hypothetical protein
MPAALLDAADDVQLVGLGAGGRTEARVRGTGSGIRWWWAAMKDHGVPAPGSVGIRANVVPASTFWLRKCAFCKSVPQRYRSRIFTAYRFAYRHLHVYC